MKMKAFIIMLAFTAVSIFGGLSIAELRVNEVPDWQVAKPDKKVYAYTSRKTRRERRHIRKMYRLTRRRGGGCFISTIQE